MAINSADGEVFVFGFDGSDVTQLTDDDIPYFAPSWSPDGDAIAVGGHPFPNVGGDKNIRVFSLSGALVANLTAGTVVDGSAVEPSWSPDGSKIAFSTATTTGQGAQTRQVTDLWMIRADGSGLTQLTSTTIEHESEPAWRSDGAWLAYVNAQGCGSFIAILQPAGTGRRDITSCPGFDISPVWLP